MLKSPLSLDLIEAFAQRTPAIARGALNNLSSDCGQLVQRRTI
jgi:hypothetical protein